jgi:mannose-1-phosphate guanylyltransferase/mannose-6-phosphate isomerase
MSVVIPVILCGGSGTRLWPLSRSDKPKQLISLNGVYTLLEATLLRAKAIAGAGDPICVTASTYEVEARQSLNRLGQSGLLLLEPEPRNTAPALCAAALVAIRSNINAIVVALPADHVIEDAEAFAASVDQAVAAAERGWLTILGVTPRHPSTGLGYIVPAEAIDLLPQVYRVGRFVEKPKADMAGDLIAAGALWNAGIVVARADAVIGAVRKHAPALLKAVERSLESGADKVDEVQLDAKAFSAAPRISFDNAILERHERVAVVALDTTWRDVGTWLEVAELYPADENGNRQTGRVQLSSSQNSFVFSPDRLTVGIGLNDLAVVSTKDALLIANRNELGQLRDIVEALPSTAGTEVAADRTVRSMDQTKSSIADQASSPLRITLGVGEIISREPPRDVWYFWIVLQGTVQVTGGEHLKIYDAKQSFSAGPGISHLLTNLGASPAKLIEAHVLVSKPY